MTRVSATEFKNNIGTFSDAAMKEPVIITSHQRDRLVLLSAEEYRRLTEAAETQAGGLSEERQRKIRQAAEYHRDTIMDSAKR